MVLFFLNELGKKEAKPVFKHFSYASSIFNSVLFVSSFFSGEPV